LTKSLLLFSASPYVRGKPGRTLELENPTLENVVHHGKKRGRVAYRVLLGKRLVVVESQGRPSGPGLGYFCRGNWV